MAPDVGKIVDLGREAKLPLSMQPWEFLIMLRLLNGNVAPINGSTGSQGHNTGGVMLTGCAR